MGGQIGQRTQDVEWITHMGSEAFKNDKSWDGEENMKQKLKSLVNKEKAGRKGRQ